MPTVPDPSMHPCYSEKAHRYFSRVHVPVAPKCNIQCNYCNRKFDCVNESRPGVTSSVVSPEKALQHLTMIASRRKDLSVVGIAGPGDALANPEKTFRTIRLVQNLFPDLLLCLSTNGLAIVDHIDELSKLNVNHVTVTINTNNVDTAQKIYSHVKIDGVRRSDREAIGEFLHRQEQGIKALVQAGIQVKANSLLLPGINDKELVSLSKRLKLMGVSLHNIMPLIAKPEHGSLFGIQQRPTPTHEQLEAVRKACGSVKQMAHCRQCRADAIGKLWEESIPGDELAHPDKNWMDLDFGYEKRKHWRELVQHILTFNPTGSLMQKECGTGVPFNGKIAVCSKGSGFADLELFSATEFYIYQVRNGTADLVNVRRFDPGSSDSRSQRIRNALSGCRAVISRQIGYEMFKQLENQGITPVSDLSDIPVEEAVLRTADRLSNKNNCGVRNDLPRAHNH